MKRRTFAKILALLFPPVSVIENVKSETNEWDLTDQDQYADVDITSGAILETGACYIDSSTGDFYVWVGEWRKVGEYRSGLMGKL